MKLGALTSLVACGACGALTMVAACGSGDAASSDDASGGASTFGANATSGGSGDGSGDGTSGRIGSSGASGNGGTSGDSGGTDGGGDGGGCSGAAADPAAAATVGSFVDKLPAGNAPTGIARTEIIDAVIKTCAAFGPTSAKAAGWDRKYCWAHLLSAMEKESGYNAALTIKDSYAMRQTPAGKANDPTVGLLQIRFSSTVHDVVQIGREDSLACIGCAIPAAFAAHAGESGDSSFWSVTGPSANASFLQDRACNIGLGGWYYYVNAMANGNAATPTYATDACAGKGTAGNLVTGLRSYLEGAQSGKGVLTLGGVNALMTTDSNAYQYISQIKATFDGMVGAVSGTHPFFIVEMPNAPEYCR